MANKKCKFMLTDGGVSLTAVNGRYCGKLVIAGEPFNQGGVSFLLPKGSKYHPPMKKATLQIRAEHEVGGVEEYFEKKGLCQVAGTPRLTFGKLQWFFIMSFVTIGLLFLEMVLDPQSIRERKFLVSKTGKDREGITSETDSENRSSMQVETNAISKFLSPKMENKTDTAIPEEDQV